MKIAFPLKNEEELANDFAHARFIGVYDVQHMKMEIFTLADIENQIGISSFFKVMTSQGLSATVSPFYSYLSLSVFKEIHIETYKANSYHLKENIAIFNEGKLEHFDVHESLLTGMCIQKCSPGVFSVDSNY
jgi:predicted Fe-Mo cluster-binding NifX family protein